MTYDCIEVNPSDTVNVEKFLNLPKRLYRRCELTADREEELLVINGKHTLSDKAILRIFIVEDINKEAVARCILTMYEHESKSYVGFFESIDNQEVTNMMLDRCVEIAKENGKQALIGPYDLSFWVKYRFNATCKDRPYSTEPYNKEYYVKLWENYGFQTTDKYYSYNIRRPSELDVNQKWLGRLQMFKDKGYSFETMEGKDPIKVIREVYWLIIKLYSKFPTYREISEKYFIALFKSIPVLARSEDIKLVYYERKLVAFVICMPNYGNDIYNINIVKKLKILWKKKTSRELLILYMGVDGGHLGLGGALAELIRQDMVKNKQRAISSLIHTDKETAVYYRELSTVRSEYRLMQLKLDKTEDNKE